MANLCCCKLYSLNIIGSTLKNITIVLNNTSHPGNIGASARAMKTMGLNQLSLVAPKSFPDQIAYARSSKAIDVLDNAQVHANLATALADKHIVFATSNRDRYLSLPTYSPRDAAELIKNACADKQQIAILFGNEQHGLSNSDMQLCNQQIIIPSNHIYGSLNLAAAVQIICYEIFTILEQEGTVLSQGPHESNIATRSEVENLFAHVTEILLSSGYLKQNNSVLAQKLKIILNKTQLSSKEVQITRGILTHLTKRINGNDS